MSIVPRWRNILFRATHASVYLMFAAILQARYYCLSHFPDEAIRLGDIKRMLKVTWGLDGARRQTQVCRMWRVLPPAIWQTISLRNPTTLSVCVLTCIVSVLSNSRRLYTNLSMLISRVELWEMIFQFTYPWCTYQFHNQNKTVIFKMNT